MSVYSVRPEMIPLAKKIVLALTKETELDEERLKKIRNAITKDNGGVLPKNLELIEAYRQLRRENKIDASPMIMKVIQKRKVRTMSGIANITVLTKDLGCPGECIFCPTEKGMPKSYLSNEPAMMRAVRNEFSAYKQVKTRLNGLLAQGHDVTKIDVRTAGGTWGAVPLWYRDRFLKGIYLALNEGPGEFIEHSDEDLKAMDLQELIKENEKAECRCVGLWVETRPDWVDEVELVRLRDYGVTGIELGIQTTDDKVNEFNKRGHGIEESLRATKLCRDIGLKVCHHLMPNLPTASLESDLKSGADLFDMEGLRPDYLKVYPTMVTPYSDLEKMVEKDPSIHTPYTDEELIEIIAIILKGTPRYCRIIRIIRDIPAESIVLGSKTSNLRQVMERRGISSEDIRAREIQDNDIKDTELRVIEYKASDGDEFFISVDETNLDKLVGLCRLRFPSDPENAIFPELEGAALIRELHVYGQQQSLAEDGAAVPSKSQHHGFGKKLMNKAEEIAKEGGFKKVAVISAIGTRAYYEKLGYKLEGTYMVKYL